jgi:hypothetical protein
VISLETLILARQIDQIIDERVFFRISLNCNGNTSSGPTMTKLL